LPCSYQYTHSVFVVFESFVYLLSFESPGSTSIQKIWGRQFDNKNLNVVGLKVFRGRYVLNYLISIVPAIVTLVMGAGMDWKINLVGSIYVFVVANGFNSKLLLLLLLLLLLQIKYFVAVS